MYNVIDVLWLYFYINAKTEYKQRQSLGQSPPISAVDFNMLHGNRKIIKADNRINLYVHVISFHVVKNTLCLSLSLIKYCFLLFTNYNMRNCPMDSVYVLHFL